MPDWGEDLGTEPEERRILSAHVPETHLIRDENLDALAQRKKDFAFKPLHGFAGRGLLAGAVVGRARLRRLVERGEDYVTQRWVAKPCLQIDGAPVWTDLRVWAYRGEIFHLSGRASRRSDRLDLLPPRWMAANLRGGLASRVHGLDTCNGPMSQMGPRSGDVSRTANDSFRLNLSARREGWKSETGRGHLTSATLIDRVIGANEARQFAIPPVERPVLIASARAPHFGSRPPRARPR